MAEVIISGISEFSLAIEKMNVEANLAARNIVTRGGEVIERHAKENFRPRPSGSRRVSKSGRVYYSGQPPFQAEPPRPTQRTGNLRNSIMVQQVNAVGTGWESLTGPSVKYGPFVEFGTNRARPFPYLAPAIRQSEVEIASIANEEWSKAL